jgi:hypothetical protein
MLHLSTDKLFCENNPYCQLLFRFLAICLLGKKGILKRYLTDYHLQALERES